MNEMNEKLMIDDLTFGIADKLPKVKNDLILSIEQIIYEITGDEVSYDDRLKISHRVVAQCLNMPMSISDHYMDVLNSVGSIIKTVISSNGNS